MATPMTSTQFLAQCIKWDVPLDVRRHPDWYKHNRDTVRAFGPVHGVVIHHTGSSAQLAMVDYCYAGDTARALPGPLAFGVITDDGVVHMVGWGRCNTQGAGSGLVLEAMEDNRVPAYPPGPDNADGNSCFYGWEFCSSGAADPFTPAQFATAVNLTAAILDFHAWSNVPASVIRHGQWTRRKADDTGGSLDWPAFITAVETRLRPPPLEDDMPTPQQVQDAVEGGIREYLRDFYSATGTGTAIWDTQRDILAALNRIATALESSK